MMLEEMESYLRQLLEEFGKSPPAKWEKETIENLIKIIEHLRSRLQDAQSDDGDSQQEE